MENRDIAIRKVRQFADSAYTAVLDSCTNDFRKELADLQAQWAANGMVISGGMSKAIAEARGKHISKLVQARLDALLEGCELYGFLDDQTAADIVKEVMNLKEKMIANSQMATEQSIDLAMGLVSREQFGQLVRSECKISHASVNVQIQRQSLAAAKKELSVTNIYHVHGHNPRWNTNSTDNSVNVATISYEEVFSNLRNEIVSGVPEGDEQRDILEKLRLLEEAQNSSSFAKRYSEFISAAANHMTLIYPIIPALTEILHKTLR